MADMTPEEKIMEERRQDPCVTKPCQDKIEEFVRILFDDLRVVGGTLTLDVEILKSPEDVADTAPKYTWTVKNGKIHFTCVP